MFQGYQPETMDFLWGIRLNNNRDWFMEHKPDYQNYLYYPTKSLAQDLSEEFRDVPNMECKLSRIYKDARMHPAVPYKESIWICLRPENTFWTEVPILYFEVNAGGCRYGFAWWSPKTTVLNRYRQYLTEHPAEFPALVKKIQKDTGLPFEVETYARKKPCPEESLEPYFNIKRIHMYLEEAPGEHMFSPDLGTDVAKCLRKLYPMYEFFLKFAE